MSSENSHPLTTVATRSLATGKYMARVAIIGPMPFERLPFDAETHLADVQMFQQEGFGAIYLIDDDRKAIVETGTSWDANRILNAVRSFGLKPADVDALVVSQDRKSTRLNSSHSQISYAVFCLKKKKRRQDRAHTRQESRSRPSCAGDFT